MDDSSVFCFADCRTRHHDPPVSRICSHLQSLQQIFKACFPENYYDKFLWIWNSFNQKVDISLLKKEKLIKLSSDNKLKVHSLNLCELHPWVLSFSDKWISKIIRGSTKNLMQLSTTYQSEKGLSSLLQIKPKYKNRHHYCFDPSLNSAVIQPGIQKLYKGT